MHHPFSRRVNTSHAKRSKQPSSSAAHPLFHDQAPTDSWIPNLVYDDEESFLGDGRAYFDDSETL